jgi:hypothetical protein
MIITGCTACDAGIMVPLHPAFLQHIEHGHMLVEEHTCAECGAKNYIEHTNWGGETWDATDPRFAKLHTITSVDGTETALVYDREPTPRLEDLPADEQEFIRAAVERLFAMPGSTLHPLARYRQWRDGKEPEFDALTREREQAKHG